MQEALYTKNGQTTTRNSFPKWSPLDEEVQRVARTAIGAISLFPDLEKRLIEALGFGPAAIMLHQLVGYWFRKPKMQDRWEAFKTYAEWRAERGLARKQVDKGREQLRRLGLVEERRKRGKKLHYRVDWVRLAGALNVEFRMSPLRSVLECPPSNGSFWAPQEGAIPHRNGVHADVGTSPAENVGGTFSLQENTQGKAEPAVAEPAAPKEVRKNKQTPPEGIAALKKSDDDWVRELASMGELHDFTEEQRPTDKYVWMSLGWNDEERRRIWRRMCRIAREAVNEQKRRDAETYEEENARGTRS